MSTEIKKVKIPREHRQYRYVMVNRGTRCPFCESADIVIKEGPDFRSDVSLIVLAECEHCDQKWREHYSLDGIEEIE